MLVSSHAALPLRAQAHPAEGSRRPPRARAPAQARCASASRLIAGARPTKALRTPTPTGREARTLWRAATTATARPAVVQAVAMADKEPFHVHFGAGRLGLGLVLPALQLSEVPFAILQRPSKEWANLAEQDEMEHVQVLINGEDAIPGGLQLYTDGGDKPLPDGGEECIPAPLMDTCSDSHLVLTNDKPAWNKLINSSTSFSCAVGPTVHEWLGPLLSQLPEAEPAAQPYLYACENDHNAVSELQKMLKGKVRVVACMVDRICARRTVDAAGLVTVETENHPGSIIMLESPEVDESLIPLAGPAVLVPEDEAVAEYFYKRKLLLVNGMHTALGFLTLVDHETSFKRLDRIDSGEEIEEVLEEDFIVEELDLITLKTATPTLQEEIYNWLAAQVLYLFSLFPLDVMLRAHETDSVEELVEQMYVYAMETVNRFSTMDDTTDRVLGGGVSNRYETRLTPTCKAVGKAKVMSKVWADNDHNKLFLARMSIDLADIIESCNNLTERAEKFAQRDEALRLASKMHCRATLASEFTGEVMDRETIAVLFDFDGTLADTEVTAMEVAFWELAPYIPFLDVTSLNNKRKREFISSNAGKAFEFMVDEVDAERAAAGLPSIETVRANAAEDPKMVSVVDRARIRFGLDRFSLMREKGINTSMTVLELQKADTVEALRNFAAPNLNVGAMLSTLQALGVPCSIATTSGKPRVPVSLKACGISSYFPPERVHSGFSDFDPPEFKPSPAVYLKAAQAEDALPKNCIAVEDSASGVGSASNAGVGLIIGYVGASHHLDEDLQAAVLLSGSRSNNRRGADIVINNMADLKYLVQFFRRERKDGRERPFLIPNNMLNARFRGRYWVNEQDNLVVDGPASALPRVAT